MGDLLTSDLGRFYFVFGSGFGSILGRCEGFNLIGFIPGQFLRPWALLEFLAPHWALFLGWIEVFFGLVWSHIVGLCWAFLLDFFWAFAGLFIWAFFWAILAGLSGVLWAICGPSSGPYLLGFLDLLIGF